MVHFLSKYGPGHIMGEKGALCHEPAPCRLQSVLTKDWAGSDMKGEFNLKVQFL